MRAQQQAVALRLRLLPGDEERVLRVARRMVGRKIQRFEVVVVRLDNRAIGDRVAQLLEDANNLMHRADHGMLSANGTPNAGQCDIDALCRECIRAAADVRGLEQVGDPRLQFVNANPDFALGLFGSALQPQIVDLGQDPVLAGHPAIAECFQISVIAHLRCFRLARCDAFASSLLQRRRRVLRQFGNGVRHLETRSHIVILSEAKKLCTRRGVQRYLRAENALRTTSFDNVKAPTTP